MIRPRVFLSGILLCFSTTAVSFANENVNATATARARQIVETTGIHGGLAVHVGCGDGQLTAALAGDRFFVHGLDQEPGNVDRARAAVDAANRSRRASIDHFDGEHLPYIDNLVNLIVVEDPGNVSDREMLRVLAPQGVAYVRRAGEWNKIVKPRPKEIDQWTHYLYDSSNNAVAKDSVVGPPQRLQWVGGPRFSRHHDKMTSMSAMVSASGRVFYIFDEAPRVSVLLPPQWRLIARDAFNGTVLWKREIAKWQSHLWPLKNGPAQLPRRLVAAGDRVYVTLAIDGPVISLDAATGETVRTYKGTEGAEEIIFSDGLLLVVVKQSDAKDVERAKRRGQVWNEAGWKIVAIRADSGETLWSKSHAVLPNTLAVDFRHAIFHDGESVVCLKRDTGKEIWKSNKVARSEQIRSFFAPTLVLYDNTVIFSGGETAGKQTGSWYRDGNDTMTALDSSTGKVLWTADHPPSGYRSAEDLLVVDGLVWTGETTSGRAKGSFTGRDPRTGEIERQFEPNVDTYWFHHRCYRGKATEKFLLMSRTGIEFVDIQEKNWIPNHFVRGACLYGIMPANGLIYAPQHPCACYLEAKLSGFNALAPAAASPPKVVPNTGRLAQGPAFGRTTRPNGKNEDRDAWPTYRHDNLRSGQAGTHLPTDLKRGWKTTVGGRLTSPVIAAGKLFVADLDNHTLYALDATSGRQLWDYTAGGQIDSPPTWYQGHLYFGSADGRVTCLQEADGTMAWQFLAAPSDRRTMSFGQLESLWPVHGSVLIQDNVLYAVAGRSMFLDGGLRLWRLDPSTGKVLSETVLNDKEETTGKNLQDFVSWLNMPTGLPDVLSSDDQFVYMRSQPFSLDGKRLPLVAPPRGRDADAGAPEGIQGTEHAHLFSPTGFLDDSWWHRSYWMFGTMYVGGWQGYYRAGKKAPAGRILVHDDARVYGFGRKPQYWKWTTPIEHQLFAAAKGQPQTGEPRKGKPSESMVRIPKSASLNIAGKPVTVSVLVKPIRPDGVILARGGNVHGFSLYLRGGRPTFSLRTNQKVHSVAAKQPVTGRWVHLTGVLTPDAGLQIYVDGQLAASGKATSLIPVDPTDAMEIGRDADSAVGPYREGFGFSGFVDDVRVYHRALAADEITQQAKAGEAPKNDPAGPVISYTFDDGRATDGSGNKNHGQVEGARSVAGQRGRALRFDSGPARVAGFDLKYEWTQDLPLYARGLVLSDGTLFVAGPEDLVDEEKVSRQINSEDVQAQLQAQTAAWAGQKGAHLWIITAEDGKKLGELKLDTPPVFDGMAAAYNRLYISGMDGSVTCLEGK